MLLQSICASDWIQSFTAMSDLQQLGGVGCAVDGDAHGQPRLVLEACRQPAHRDAIADDVDVGVWRPTNPLGQDSAVCMCCLPLPLFCRNNCHTEPTREAIERYLQQLADVELHRHDEAVQEPHV